VKLLRSVVGAPLDPQAVDRVLADTERNPLALVEVGSDFTAGELAERAYQPEPIPVGQRLRQHARDGPGAFGAGQGSAPADVAPS